MSGKKRAVEAAKGKGTKAAPKKRSRASAPTRPGRPTASKKAARPRTNVTKLSSETKGQAEISGRSHGDRREVDESTIPNAATDGSPSAEVSDVSAGSSSADSLIDATPEALPVGGGDREPAPARRGEQSLQARFEGWSIAQLREHYFDLVQRPTGSEDRAYLIWKINEAEKGRVKVGPRQTRRHEGPGPDIMVIPLRIERDLAAAMDDAWRSRGIRNRMEFFRRAVRAYLQRIGARDVAERFNVTGA
ncbi:ribbon-helix-helix domain-containing protein [Pendulispora brunnea]|uniref:Ribbon-helix-helix domain-containing protein n=1 Tax=Pendulispora brunnea TaxID=2905690 RepID=A0ABZ2KCI4_9BACT